MEYDDHDPWNDPAHRHPRADQLMRDEMFWDCVNELAPFGSDKGADAYAEYRRWREENPGSNLIDCLSWVLDGRLGEYNSALIDDAAIDDCDKSAIQLNFPDAFSLDATIIAMVLGQLVDEGRIDVEAKPFAKTAVDRQSHPRILAKYRDETTVAERRAVLQAIREVIDVA